MNKKLSLLSMFCFTAFLPQSPPTIYTSLTSNYFLSSWKFPTREGHCSAKTDKEWTEGRWCLPVTAWGRKGRRDSTVSLLISCYSFSGFSFPLFLRAVLNSGFTNTLRMLLGNARFEKDCNNCLVCLSSN